MSRAPVKRLLAASALVLATTAAGTASAGDNSTAEHLFQVGLDAMKRNDFVAACEAFNGSNEADASPGTQINLALCNEKQGKVATAWGWYRTAAGLAEQRGQPARAELARAEAAKLEPKLHKLVVTLKTPVDGIAITRDGVAVPAAVLGKEVPVDPGEHTLEVTAKGKKPYKRKIAVAASPGVDRVEVPTLEDATDGASAPGAGGALAIGGAPSAATPAGADKGASSGGGSDGSTQRNVGLILGGVGLVGGVVSTVLVFATIGEEKDRKEQVANAQTFRLQGDEANAKRADESAESHREAAAGNQTGAIIAGVAGGALVITGVVLIVTAPSGTKSTARDGGASPKAGVATVAPLVGSGTYGFGLGGSF